MQNEDGVRLSPHKSFELWMEIVKDKSSPWRKSEINAASSFSYALQKHINYPVIRAQEDRNSSLNEELHQVKDSVERMRFAAEKMQMLIEDTLTCSKAGSMEKVFAPLSCDRIS